MQDIFREKKFIEHCIISAQASQRMDSRAFITNRLPLRYTGKSSPKTMNDIPCREDYTYEKLILYLYLCAAYADYEIEDSEVHMIRNKMVRAGYISEENFEPCWQQVLSDFKRHNDLESMEHISGCVRDLRMDETTRK